jgi:hypothetical protein
MVIGGIDPYLYHTGDEFIKGIKQNWKMYAYTRHYSRHTFHVTETLSSNGTRKFSMLFPNYTNLPKRNKTLPISQLGYLLNRSRNSHNIKHNVWVTPPKFRDSKILIAMVW